MYYCLSCYPQLGPELTLAIKTIRSAYDPTAPFYEPHVTLVFPTPEQVGLEPLCEHIRQVLESRKPFEIQLGKIERTPSHWLLLGLCKGGEDFRQLYRAMHTGILSDGRDLDKYIPHMSLGLFVREGVAHDWRNPRESDFDSRRYEEAMQLVNALPLDETIRVEKFRLVGINDSVIDWVRGRRVAIPEDADETVLREFVL